METIHFIPPSQRRILMMSAQADSAPVIITGSRGTGKGVIARWIHNNGPRATRPFVTASHDQSLAEAIFLAQGGTLMIPEIGERNLKEQKLLLDFFKTKAIPHPQQEGMKALANVRVITTTSQVLEGRAQTGLFNAELLQKLNVFRIEMPELSTRMEEFEDIATGILQEITRELHKEYIKGFTAEAWETLKDHNWKGNLRELRNVLRMAVINSREDQIGVEDLPEFNRDRINFMATRQEFEKIYIEELLKTFDYQIDKTCQVSRIDKETLLSKVRQYGIRLDKKVDAVTVSGNQSPISP